MNTDPPRTFVPKKDRGGKRTQPNPITSAINIWIDSLPPLTRHTLHPSVEQLQAKAPKRWVVYPPMALLPSDSFDSEWTAVLTQSHVSRADPHISRLCELILEKIGRKEGKGILTHLAMNAGIPLYEPSTHNDASQNILRTPSGIHLLSGDFGPALKNDDRPGERELQEAFWVSTKQNGITQVWAPRYTMFSRGNIKEKTRLLRFHADNPLPNAELKQASAIDLYAGIGYFVFSYVKMGLGRVLGWELNPWSVEGLRRGAVANGWSIKIVDTEEDLTSIVETIVVFLEDNLLASKRLKRLDLAESVMHVNCGLLPSSILSWQVAIQVIGRNGWLHLHENATLKGVSARRLEIEAILHQWLHDSKDTVSISHVELVKSYAPSIWHCVFDAKITRVLANGSLESRTPVCTTIW
ncbi:BgTH12-05366 [Blumeria graminis f. sp. triticale]|uniref:tRNA wybutosine-synthesizing protein 2 n=3 Tax=Blumeria graminis TaxID=34373 RepID=A0A381L2U9_BLUGR|nr:S-adenosylmethionine-dependent methyltransferase [Blumeria graminis f. sp. tritici 96224]CAD6502776.1 BgTH12-05366 [Blumeria graminis f. sp. triticale]VDB88251.1 Bgt-3149 [Blumeria graminis f. sp. tritici]